MVGGKLLDYVDTEADPAADVKLIQHIALLSIVSGVLHAVCNKEHGSDITQYTACSCNSLQYKKIKQRS